MFAACAFKFIESQQNGHVLMMQENKKRMADMGLVQAKEKLDEARRY